MAKIHSEYLCKLSQNKTINSDNIHVRHSKRYKKTNSILVKVFISAYTWDWGLKVVLRGFLLYLHCLNFEKKTVFVY